MYKLIINFKKLIITIINNKKLVIGFSILLFLILFGIVGPILNSYKKVLMGTYSQDQSPSFEHLLGTDTMGRDQMTVLVYGVRTSILIGIFAGIIGISIGMLLGFISGYAGGLIDTILMAATDVLLVIPTWPLLVILSQYLKALSIPLFSLLLAIFSWPGTARRMRSQVLTFKERGFIRLARISGQSSLEVTLFEIAPNMLPYIGANLAMAVSGAVMAESGLSLLGLAPVGTVTLGLNLQWAMRYGALTKGMWWWIMPTVTCLILIFFGLQLVNIGLDEVYNPRLKK